MKVKKYTGKNIQEIYQEIRLEMGKDAIILHTKKQKKGGFFGFFAKEFFEITAAVEELSYEDEVMEETTKEKESQAVNQQIAMPQSYQFKIEEVDENHEPKEETSEELKDMQQKMEEMMEMLEMSQHSFKGEAKKYYDHLLTQEVESKLASRMMKRVEKKYYDKENQESMEALLKEEIFRIIKKINPIDRRMRKKQLVVALIGPTGVGKTTTIAKLAANYTILDKKKVALVTVDTYRIAAVEQLKTVGEIIGVPVDVVFTPQNLKNTISGHYEKDFVFIDTAGRSHKNHLQMSEIKGFLEAAEPDEIFLVLSAATRYRDMLDIVDKYCQINIKKIIFTKLDETTTYGSILNIVDKTKKQLSYFTTGQSVPDDIELADPEKFYNLLMGDLSNE